MSKCQECSWHLDIRNNFINAFCWFSEFDNFIFSAFWQYIHTGTALPYTQALLREFFFGTAEVSLSFQK